MMQSLNSPENCNLNTTETGTLAASAQKQKSFKKHCDKKAMYEGSLRAPQHMPYLRRDQLLLTSTALRQ
jgi:hypothetical protein